MAASPKKGIKHDRNVDVSVHVDAMGYPDTVRMDADYRYHYQSGSDVDRLVQKIERAGAAIESRPIKKEK